MLALCGSVALMVELYSHRAHRGPVPAYKIRVISGYYR